MKKVVILMILLIFVECVFTSCKKSAKETNVNNNLEEVSVNYDGIYIEKFNDELIDFYIKGINSMIRGILDGVDGIDDISDINFFINYYQKKMKANDFSTELNGMLLNTLLNFAKEIQNAYYISKVIPEELKEKKVVIPSVWKDGEKIFAIGPNAFDENTTITSITILDGVIQIMDEAFNRCSNLTNINLPDSIIAINNNAFKGCSSLTSISIPKSAVLIKGEVFNLCDNLEDIYYKGTYNQLKLMPDKQWMETDTGATIHCIDRTVICEKPSLSGIYVDKISSNRTYKVSKVDTKILSSTKVIIPPKINGGIITEIASESFKDCDELTTIKLPNTIIEIGNSAFKGCKSLTNIFIPNNVALIGESAFADCTNLKNIEIPNSVTRIGASAFFGCIELKDIVIPKDLIAIGDYAFENCVNLSDIYYNGTVREWNNLISKHIISKKLNNDTTIHCIDNDIVYSKGNSL